jgi:hypothetical protein
LALAAISAERLNPLVAYELIFDVLVVIRPKKLRLVRAAFSSATLKTKSRKRSPMQCIPSRPKYEIFAKRLFQGSSRLRRRRTQGGLCSGKSVTADVFIKIKAAFLIFCVYFHPLKDKTR